MRRRILTLLAVPAVALCALAACSAPSPAATTTLPPVRTAPAPSPTPTPTPTVEALAEIVVSSTGVDLLASDGSSLGALGYLEPTADIVARLSAHLGEPAEVRVEATNHTGPGTSYEWDGIAVRSEDRWARIPTDELPEFTARWWILVTAPVARGAAVRTVDGVAVGDPTSAVEDRFPDATERLVLSSGIPRVDIYLDPAPAGDGRGETAPDGYLWRVWVLDEEPEDVIQEFRAPSNTYGA